MESESLPQENTNIQKKKGITIYGYTVPYWVAIVVVLVILYFAYERGYLEGVVGTVEKAISGEKPVQLKGGYIESESIQMPETAKKLFGNRI